MAVITFILVMIFSIATWVTYHKIFDVAYFDLGRGLLKEFVGCFICGVILTALAVKFWWIIDILIVIVGLLMMLKFRRKEHKIIVLICVGIIAIIVGVIGISINNQSKETRKNAQAYVDVVEENYIV